MVSLPLGWGSQWSIINERNHPVKRSEGGSGRRGERPPPWAWPARYLVAECITMSAPRFEGSGGEQAQRGMSGPAEWASRKTTSPPPYPGGQLGATDLGSTEGGTNFPK